MWPQPSMDPGVSSGATNWASALSRMPWPQEQPSEAWQRHCYLPYGQPGQVDNQILQYGQPSTLDEFADLAQVANYVQYR